MTIAARSDVVKYKWVVKLQTSITPLPSSLPNGPAARNVPSQSLAGNSSTSSLYFWAFQHRAEPVPGGGVQARSASTQHNGEREQLTEQANAFWLRRTCSEIAFIRTHTCRQADAPQPSHSAGPGRPLPERWPGPGANGQDRRAASELPAARTSPGPRRQADRSRPPRGAATKGRRQPGGAASTRPGAREARRAPCGAALR